MSLDPARTAALLGVKSRAIVRDTFGVAEADLAAAAFPDGAALIGPDAVYVYSSADAPQPLGAALALAHRRKPGAPLHLMLDADPGMVARRATAFDPMPQIWRIDGAELHPATAAPVPEPIPVPAGIDAFVDQMLDEGLDIAVEHGVVMGEVLGLEVARVSIDPDGTARLDVGVGRFDREAGAMLRGPHQIDDALADAVAMVRGYRRAGATPHAVGRLSPERWLRAMVLAAPDLVGLDSATAVESVEPRTNLLDAWPAFALGVGVAGDSVLVATSLGLQLELVAHTADQVLRHRPDRVVLAMPARDVMPILVDQAKHLEIDVEFTPLELPYQPPAA